MNFSFLGGLANLLPGYVQGQRQAIQDNWQDLMHYNQAQQGQLSNAFTEATWQPRLDMFQNAWLRDSFNTYQQNANMRLNELMRPYQEMQGLAWNWYAPQIAHIGPDSLWRTYNMTRSNPGLLGAVQGSAGSKPSSVG